MTWKVRTLLACAVSAAALFSHAQAAFAEGFKVAFFASSAQNGFNQAVYEGY